VIEYHEDPESHVVEIMIDGKVGKAEFDEIAGRLEAHIRAHGKAAASSWPRSGTTSSSACAT
jgi:hypothetical protein